MMHGLGVLVTGGHSSAAVTTWTWPLFDSSMLNAVDTAATAAAATAIVHAQSASLPVNELDSAIGSSTANMYYLYSVGWFI